MSDTQISEPAATPATPGAPAAPAAKNGLGLAGLIIGIVALVGAFIPFINYTTGFLAFVGLVLAIIGLTRKARPKGKALAGTIISGIALVLSIILATVYTAGFVAAVDSALPGAVQEAIEEAESAAGDTPAGDEPANAGAWADDSFGTFEPVTHTGTGDNLVSLPAGATVGIVTATHDGARNFIINALDATNGSTGDLLVNTIGAYSGTSAFGFNAMSDATTLEVNADGNWSIVISPVSAAPAFAASGTGDAVHLFDGDAGKLTATHAGERNFIVMEETGEAFSMGILVNDIGVYSGTVPLSAGPSVLVIRADGAWTLLAE